MKASRAYGQILPPLEMPAPPPPAIDGIEVRDCCFQCWLAARREMRHACREAKVRARLPAVQAEMRARKAARSAT